MIRLKERIKEFPRARPETQNGETLKIRWCSAVMSNKTDAERNGSTKMVQSYPSNASQIIIRRDHLKLLKLAFVRELPLALSKVPGTAQLSENILPLGDIHSSAMFREHQAPKAARQGIR